MTSHFRSLEIDKLPYSSRQLIIVQPDQVVAATRDDLIKTQRQQSEEGWMDVARRVGKAIIVWGPPYSALIEVAADSLKAWAKARDSGLNVLQIAQSEAATLDFPPGHPREQTVYVAHPAASRTYYTAATFHRMAFEHKFAEAVDLLMSLGATSLTVEHVQGWSREFSANLSANFPENGFDASAQGASSASSKLLFDAALDNKTSPALPEGLVWYAHEPTWQSVAKGRLKHGMRDFNLEIAYEDDFGINAGLKIRAQKAGLELGGAFEDHVATRWKIRGRFGTPE